MDIIRNKTMDHQTFLVFSRNSVECNDLIHETK